MVVVRPESQAAHLQETFAITGVHLPDKIAIAREQLEHFNIARGLPIIFGMHTLQQNIYKSPLQD